jgi:hypothetical protein
MRKIMAALIVLITATTAWASVRFINQSSQVVGEISKVKCGTNMSCAVSSGQLVLTSGVQTQVASTTVSLTAAQCGATIVSNSADVVTLPEASTVLGCRYTFICGTADDFDINPADGTDVIGPISVAAATAVTTITPSAGDAIRCTDIGTSVVLEAIGADRWAPVGAATGPLTDVN